jgi:hypothetical protein
VHQVRPAGHGRGFERQRLDQIGLGLRRRRDGRTLVDFVQVVDEPDVNAALVRADERITDDVVGPVLQPDVVERELEGLARAVDERRDLLRDVQRRLAAVGERVNLDENEGRRIRPGNLASCPPTSSTGSRPAASRSAPSSWTRTDRPIC